MTDAVKHPELKIFKLQRRVSRKDEASRRARGAMPVPRASRHPYQHRRPRPVLALPDRNGSLRRRTSPEPQTRIACSGSNDDAGWPRSSR